MKKKIIVLIVILAFQVPGMSVFAQNVNLLQGESYMKSPLYQVVTSRWLKPKSTACYVFDKPVNVTGYSLHSFADVRLSIEGEEGHVLDVKKEGSYKSNVKIKNATSVCLSTTDSYERKIILFELYGEEILPITYDVVTDLEETHDFESVDLTWNTPENIELKNIVVKKNGVELATLNHTVRNYKVTGLNADTSYTFEVFARYSDGGLSDAVSISVKTDSKPPPPEPVEEVKDLTAKSTHERVDLSWTLPEVDNLKHVIIYRDTLKKNLFDKLLGVSTVKAADTPIFETNGTFFKDLTVQPETKYEYTLTTMSTDKIESDGVSIQVITPKEPIPEIEGGGHEKDPETGDYTYTWLKPTEGQVKVMVGGKLYKTVPAADGKIVIPAADMKFTLLGQPDVKLIPVSPDGNEGKPVSPPSGGGDGGGTGGIGSGSLPFKPGDLMTTTFQLIGLLSGIILIALVIQLVPRIVAVIKASIAKGRAVK